MTIDLTAQRSLEIYLQREVDTDTSLALAAVLIGLAALLVLGTGVLGRVRTSR